MSATLVHDQAKSLYVKGESVSQIAQILARTRTTIYSYKAKDLKKGICWDELRFLKATDTQDAQRSEEDFIALLINRFERSLDDLNNLDVPEQLAEIDKYAKIFFKLKLQRDNPKVNKAEVAKAVLQQISAIALQKEATAVIAFLSQHAEKIVNTVIK